MIFLNLLIKEEKKEEYLFIGSLIRAAGVSRSSAIICSYLMKSKLITFN